LSKNLIVELKEFLKNSKLSNYEINSYMTLLYSDILTAREISGKSGVPSGRIYEVLEKLKEYGMIEIQESRPKMYRSKSLNLALHNLISYQNNENQRKISFLYDQAKFLESKLYDSDFLIKQDASKIFWSTAFGVPEIFSLYINNFNDLKEELLMTGFLNDNTIKILPFAKNFYEGIINALNRGVQVKYLWSFEYDDRPLSNEQKIRNKILYKKLIKKFKELYNISSEMDGLEMKLIHKKIPTYYDIFDKKRIMIKLQNPLNPSRIFASLNILDPNLAKELKKKFLSIWLFESIKGFPENE